MDRCIACIPLLCTSVRCFDCTVHDGIVAHSESGLFRLSLFSRESNRDPGGEWKMQRQAAYVIALERVPQCEEDCSE